MNHSSVVILVDSKPEDLKKEVCKINQRPPTTPTQPQDRREAALFFIYFTTITHPPHYHVVPLLLHEKERQKQD